MNWLVTGCSGFVGSNIVDYLIKKNQTVIGLDIVKPIISSNNKFKFVKFDLTKKKGLKKYVNNADYIINLAALVSIPYSLKFPKKTKYANVKIFKNILNYVNPKKTKCIIFASSSAVYGSGYKNHEKIDIRKFQSAYAESKFLNEIDAKKFYKKNKITIIGLRYFNLFGPYSKINSRYSSVITKWIKQIKKKKIINIYGSGNQTRDFVFVEDVAKINYLLAKIFAKKRVFKIFNIGTEVQTSLNLLLKYILSIAKIKKTKIRYHQSIDFGVMNSAAIMTLFKTNLKFKFTTLKKGLKITLQLYEI